MKKVIYLFSLVVFFAACDSAEISPKSKSYIYNSDKVVIGLFEDEQIVIPLLNQIIGSEINFQTKRALVKKAEVVGVMDEYKYLITELEFLDINNQDGMKSIKVASILFGEDDLYRYDEMMASGGATYLIMENQIMFFYIVLVVVSNMMKRIRAKLLVVLAVSLEDVLTPLRPVMSLLV